MRTALLFPIAILLAVAGCIPSTPDLTGPFTSVGQIAAVTAVEVASSGAALRAEGVQVAIVNQTASTVRVNVSARVGTFAVHTARRDVPGNGAIELIGPDAADNVIVTINGMDETARLIASGVFVLGLDYAQGDTIILQVRPPTQPDEPPTTIDPTLEDPAPPVPTIPPADPNDAATPEPNNPPTDDPNEATPPTGVPLATITGLERDTKLFPGTPLLFGVKIENCTAAGRAFVYAVPEAAGSDTRAVGAIAILTGEPVAPLLLATWDTRGVPAGVYRLYAEIRDGARLGRSALTAGRVVVFDSPDIAALTPTSTR